MSQIHYHDELLQAQVFQQKHLNSVKLFTENVCHKYVYCDVH